MSVTRVSFVAELQRRNVHRAVLFYAGAAWLLVQVATQVFPFFDVPNWAVRIVVVGVLIGFPFAMLFSWFYEWTPQGIKRESEIDRSESVTRQTGKTLDRWIIAVLSLAVIFLLANTFVLHRDTGKADSLVSAKSIAVLPFVNMSGEAANEYFSDGVSEEILNVLARTPELLVAARTSSFSFKGGKEEVPEIAKALKVRMVLEGSVRKQGERVRITAQLIDASNGFHVWSETYDRDLKDIFAIQDEIAKAIADALKLKLGTADAPVVASRGTRNPAAYDFYLRGLALWQQRGETSLRQAVVQFEQAATADPKFAEAYAGLALTYAILPDYSVQMSYAEGTRRARDNAECALALNSSLPEPYSVLAYLADREHRRDAAEALYERSIALRPSYATAYQWFGGALQGAGRLDDALKALEHASALDPRSAIIANNRAIVLIELGRYAEAVAVCEPILDVAPDNWLCLKSTANAWLMLEDFGASRRLYDRVVVAQKNPGVRGEVDEIIEALEGHGDRHAGALRLAAYEPQSESDPASGNVFESNEIATLLVRLGEPQLALTHLESLAVTDESGLTAQALMPLTLGPLHCEPRFIALVKQVNATDPHYAQLCAGKS